MKQVSCDTHDYFEIVCMRRSRVSLWLSDGTRAAGVARDLTCRAGVEMIVIDDGLQLMPVALTAITRLEALGNAVAQHNFSVECQSE